MKIFKLVAICITLLALNGCAPAVVPTPYPSSSSIQVDTPANTDYTSSHTGGFSILEDTKHGMVCYAYDGRLLCYNMKELKGQ